MTFRLIRAALRRLRYIRRFAVPLRETPSCRLPEIPDVDGSTVVFIRGYPLRPATVYVRRGGRISWLNCGAATTMHTTGPFTYRCEPQPFMTGSVIVE